jgi:uncharacterized protein (TIGR00304 family)
MLFVGGMILIGAAVASGEAHLSLVVIFPIFSGTGGMFLLGVVFIILSLLLGFAFMTMGQLEMAEYQRTPANEAFNLRRSAGKGTKYGGVVLIGPFPIAFGSSMKIAIIMLLVGIVVAIVALAIIISAIG